MIQMWASGVIAVVLIGAVKILVPKMVEAESAGKRFGLGVMLFAIYTAVTLLMFYHFCTFDGNGFGSGSEVFTRVVLAFVIMNFITLFSACLYFFTREKRKLTQEEKMRLKDL